jgi:UDP-GlcNAc:undecaprenyl-phosphate GlcNAc-1-phosphate transferase
MRGMNLLLLTFTFFLTLLSIHLLIRNALRLGLVDVPNARSIHKTLTPRGAGIGFVGSVLTALLLFDFGHLSEYYYVYLSVLLVFSVGVLDDRIDVSPKLKFIFIFFATLLLYFNGLSIDCLGEYFGYRICLPAGIPVLLFSFFAIAGYTNALNLIDGLDGLAGTVSIIILGTFLAIGLIHNDELIITLSSLFIVALAAFLYFNWNPARIFMGDSGSLTLGFVISLLSVKSLAYITPAAMLFIIAIPLLDTFIVITRRAQRGISLFTADKNHLHHFLYKMKGDVKFTVILIVYIQLAFSIIGYQLRTAENVLSLILFGVLFFIFLSLFDQRIRKRRRPKKVRHKHKAAHEIVQGDAESAEE